MDNTRRLLRHTGLPSMTSRDVSTHGPRRFVYTLDELLDLRVELRKGQHPRDLSGAERFHELLDYGRGYSQCCIRNNFPDYEYAAFIEWMRDSRGGLPEGWPDDYTRECGGDPVKAMGRWLDSAAGFREQRQGQPSFPPPLALEDRFLLPTPEKYKSVLGKLSYAHWRVRNGYPAWLSYGTETLPAMAVHIRGYVRCCERNGFPDARWHDFTQWLSHTRELPPGAWVSRLLQACDGDHERAMRRMLELVSEYEREQEEAT